MSRALDPELTLDGSGAIHQQIVRQLSRLIRSGVLSPGEELPSVRAIAVGLAINPDAVETAFSELEKTGYVTRSEGTGVLVAPRAAWLGHEPTRLKELCADFLSKASCSGFSADEVLRMLHALIEKEIP